MHAIYIVVYICNETTIQIIVQTAIWQIYWEQRTHKKSNEEKYRGGEIHLTYKYI